MIKIKFGTDGWRAIIAKEFTETLEKVANKPKKVTYVVFDEVNRENWAVGDKLLG